MIKLFCDPNVHNTVFEFLILHVLFLLLHTNYLMFVMERVDFYINKALVAKHIIFYISEGFVVKYVDFYV